MPPRRSGLQLQVLSWYRCALRAARSLPLARASRAALVTSLVREVRSKAASVERLDHQRIEHLLRLGRRRVAALSGAGVTGAAWAAGAGDAGDVPGSVWAMVGKRE